MVVINMSDLHVSPCQSTSKLLNSIPTCSIVEVSSVCRVSCSVSCLLGCAKNLPSLRCRSGRPCESSPRQLLELHAVRLVLLSRLYHRHRLPQLGLSLVSSARWSCQTATEDLSYGSAASEDVPLEVRDFFHRQVLFLRRVSGELPSCCIPAIGIVT